MKFKRLCKAMLEEENYIDTLGYCASRLLKYSEDIDREIEVERIIEILWNMAYNCDIEDATTQVLRIETALSSVMYK